MKKNKWKALIFFVFGISLFYLVFRDTDVSLLLNEIERFHLGWILLSIGLNLFSQFIRALRWQLLFEPLEFKPRRVNLFLSILILGFTNQLIPRGGEVARLGVLSKYEKIPFSRLLGMALVERLIDLFILLSIFVVLLIWQFQRIQKILELPEINAGNINTALILGISAAVLVAIVLFWIIWKKVDLGNRIQDKLKQFTSDVKKGFSVWKKIPKKSLFLSYSVLIYIVWLLMLYVLFFAYPPTAALSFEWAFFTFGLSALAFLLPVQSGMGGWHFLVVQCLMLTGIAENSGKSFALIAHAATNYIYILTGLLAFLILPLLNRGNKVNTQTPG